MRPAFYALDRGGWRDYWTLLHPPYTLWHLSYVAIGAALAPTLHTGRLLAALAAFGLAVGVGAHALDELRGRPLRTAIRSETLVALAVASIGGAVAIGLVVAARTTWWLLPLIGAGAFLVCAYNLELLGGRFHTDLWFVLSWGAFPLLTGYFVTRESFRADAFVGAVAAALFTTAQRVLSKRVRAVRRRGAGSGEELAAPEAALLALSAAVVALAAALLTMRLG